MYIDNLKQDELNDAYEDGYYYASQLFTTIGKRYERDHKEKLSEIAKEVDNDLNKIMENPNRLDEVCFEENYMLVLSRMNRCIARKPDQVLFEDEASTEEARRKGIEDAILLMKEIITNTADHATSEERPIIDFLQNILLEVIEVTS